MVNRIRWALFGLLLIAQGSVLAASMFNIQAFSTLAEVRKEWPGAVEERFAPAWIKRGQVAIKLTGKGLPGMLFLYFDDGRAAYKDLVSSESAGTIDSGVVAAMKWEAAKPEENALTLNWFRWVPVANVPKERVIKLYGAPSRCQPSPADLSPMCEWRQHGVIATLTDDEKSVVMIDFNFSAAEIEEGRSRRYPFFPAPKRPWVETE